jgi:hypothetical protein
MLCCARLSDDSCRPYVRPGPMAEDPVTRLVNRAGIICSNLLEQASVSGSVTDTPGCIPGAIAGRRRQNTTAEGRRRAMAPLSR